MQPVFRPASKTEAYRQAVKPGWGTEEWYGAAGGYKNPISRDHSDKTQQFVCDKDSRVDLYTKNPANIHASAVIHLSVKRKWKRLSGMQDNPDCFYRREIEQTMWTG